MKDAQSIFLEIKDKITTDLDKSLQMLDHHMGWKDSYVGSDGKTYYVTRSHALSDVDYKLRREIQDLIELEVKERYYT